VALGETLDCIRPRSVKVVEGARATRSLRTGGSVRYSATDYRNRNCNIVLLPESTAAESGVYR